MTMKPKTELDKWRYEDDVKLKEGFKHSKRYYHKRYRQQLKKENIDE